MEGLLAEGKVSHRMMDIKKKGFLRYFLTFGILYMELPRRLSGKESARQAEAVGLIPGLGQFPAGGHGNPLQHCCWENAMDRGAWHAAVSPLGRKSQRQLSN